MITQRDRELESERSRIVQLLNNLAANTTSIGAEIRDSVAALATAVTGFLDNIPRLASGALGADSVDGLRAYP